MDRAPENSGNFTQDDNLSIDPRVVDFLLLDERITPGITLDEGWVHVVHDDKRFVELAHGGLVYVHENFPGVSPEAIAKSQGFKEGIAFAVLALRNSLVALSADARMTRPPVTVYKSPPQKHVPDIVDSSASISDIHDSISTRTTTSHESLNDTATKKTRLLHNILKRPPSESKKPSSRQRHRLAAMLGLWMVRRP